MKKQLFLFFTFICLLVNSLFAQVENDPCSAVCLTLSGSVSGKSPDADGFSPNANLPCGSGTSEDNPTWYTFVPSQSSFTVNVTTGKCIGGSGSIQVTFFEGDDCGSVSAIGCLNCVTSGKLTATVIPGKQYWIQIDGCAEAVCEYTLTYDPKELLNTASAPVITGLKTLCNMSEQQYEATLTPNGGINSFTWSIMPANSGANILSGQGESVVNIKFTTSGTYQICAKPQSPALLCLPAVKAACYTVVVKDSKKYNCSVQICPENYLTITMF